MLDYIRIQYDT